jgi:hypothetical protein
VLLISSEICAPFSSLSTLKFYPADALFSISMEESLAFKLQLYVSISLDHRMIHAVNLIQIVLLRLDPSLLRMEPISECFWRSASLAPVSWPYGTAYARHNAPVTMTTNFTTRVLLAAMPALEGRGPVEAPCSTQGAVAVRCGLDSSTPVVARA